MRKEQANPRRRFLGKYDAFKYGWLQYIKLIIIFIVIIFIIFFVLIGFSSVSGHSMDTTLHMNQKVMYFRPIPRYKHGDIVSIHMPSGDYYIKRVIGTPGDTIDIHDGNLYVNGQLMDEPYAQGQTLEEIGIVKYPYTVMEGDLFVLGDNREKSVDSRAFGSVNKRQVMGKIIFQFR